MENPKVLLLGSSGQLGQTLFHRLKKDFNIMMELINNNILFDRINKDKMLI